MTTCLGKSCSFGFVRVFRWRLSNFVICYSFPLGIKGRMWVVIATPDHCLSIFFTVVSVESSSPIYRRFIRDLILFPLLIY